MTTTTAPLLSRTRRAGAAVATYLQDQPGGSAPAGAVIAHCAALGFTANEIKTGRSRCRPRIYTYKSGFTGTWIWTATTEDER